MSHDTDSEQRGALQHEAEHASPGKRNSVLIYLVILFAAAFLLLLLSYFMQQRASRDAYNDLQQSSDSAVQTLDNMLQENQDLKDQVAQLEEQNQSLQTEAEEAQRQLAEQQSALDASQAQLDALGRLNQIRSLYNAGRYSQARELLTSWGEPESGETARILGELSAELTEEERSIYDPLSAWQSLMEWL